MRRIIIAGSLGALGALAFAACKLDLDESLIDSGDASLGGNAGMAGGGAGGTAGSSSGGSGGSGGAIGDAGPCDADNQCSSDAACLEGRCAGGQCLFELCPSKNTCEGRTCETTSGTCSQASTFGFKAASLELDADVGCGGIASRCVAAFGDLVFVSTDDGNLHAWRTTNPASPAVLSVDAPTFPIARMVATESRVLLMSTVTNGKIQLAWIDAPASPSATSLSSTSAGVTLSAGVSAVYPSGTGSFLMVQNDAGSFYPAALLDLPIANNSTLTQYPSTGLVSGATIVASSGTRLVSYRVDTGSTPTVPTFTLVTAAGTTNAQNGTEKTVSFEAPPSLAANYFWSGYDGSVLWATNRVYQSDAGTPATSAVVLRWPITGTSDTIDGSLEVDIATYSEGDWNSARRGPCALIDSSTVLVTTAYPADTSQTLVRPVTRSSGTLNLGAATTVLPFSVNSIGIAANRKVGFVLTPSPASTTPPKATLNVFAPSCG